MCIDLKIILLGTVFSIEHVLCYSERKDVSGVIRSLHWRLQESGEDDTYTPLLFIK